MNWIKITPETELSVHDCCLLHIDSERDYVTVRWSAHYKQPVCLVTGALLTLEYFTHYMVITPPKD